MIWMKISGYVSRTHVEISCKFRDDWLNSCWLLSIYVMNHALTKVHWSISWKQNEISTSLTQLLISLVQWWPTVNFEGIGPTVKEMSKMWFLKNSKWQKIQCGGPYGFSGKAVEFDPRNVYTKFHVNRTYGVGVTNFKVKKCSSLIIAPPSDRSVP